MRIFYKTCFFLIFGLEDNLRLKFGQSLALVRWCRPNLWLRRVQNVVKSRLTHLYTTGHLDDPSRRSDKTPGVINWHPSWQPVCQDR